MLKFYLNGGIILNKRDILFIFTIIKLLYILTILCGCIALRLEIEASSYSLLRLRLDTEYILDSLKASFFLLGGASFIFFRYA